MDSQLQNLILEYYNDNISDKRHRNPQKILSSPPFSRNSLKSRENAFRAPFQEGVMGSNVLLNASLSSPTVYGFSTAERFCEAFNGFCQLFWLNETAPSQL